MLLKKTRAVPLSKERKIRDPKKGYFTPVCYSSQKKSTDGESSYYKKEDSV